MKTLQEIVNEQGMTRRALARKAGTSFRALTDIASGKCDEMIQNKSGKGYTGRKRIGAIQSMARILVACGQDPQEWVRASGLSFTPEEKKTITAAISPKMPEFGPEERNTLSVIANDPLTKEDAEQLLKAQEVLGEYFTVKMAVELLISRHKKNG